MNRNWGVEPLSWQTMVNIMLVYKAILIYIYIAPIQIGDLWVAKIIALPTLQEGFGLRPPVFESGEKWLFTWRQATRLGDKGTGIGV